MARRHNTFAGLDIGLVSDFTALAVVRPVEPEEPGDLPVVEVAHLARARGAPFDAVAREVGRVAGALGGLERVAIDQTGVGAGAVQACRRAGLNIVGCNITGGRQITGRGNTWNVPSNLIYERPRVLMAQGRLRYNPGAPMVPELLEDMRACVVEYGDTGRVRYRVDTRDGHGDLLVSLGLAVCLVERAVNRGLNLQNRAAVRERQGEAGRPERISPYRKKNTAREVLDRRRAERESEWSRSDANWIRVGWDGKNEHG